MKLKKRLFWLAAILWNVSLAAPAIAIAEDGYDLWLRYPQAAPEVLTRYRTSLTHIVTGAPSPTLEAARAELACGLEGLLGTALPQIETMDRSGALVFGTPRSSTIIAGLKLPLNELGNEGYLL